MSPAVNLLHRQRRRLCEARNYTKYPCAELFPAQILFAFLLCPKGAVRV